MVAIHKPTKVVKVTQDRQLTYRAIEAPLGIGSTSIYKILHDDLTQKLVMWQQCLQRKAERSIRIETQPSVCQV